ncbi:subtilisin family serine protease/plastocyanin [Streptomyces aurantiacus]|uniref:S8 family peptidase n=1 Tax=Streptomyces aurantiacus TaxID=47760 RepID=UPI00278C9933|nr:S8 family serine peptidase [Streptomyces aurantiacus]MDQ0774872.1 subtilisin family serine protease/plastocyanin [Streptomyces aurantiacus]
MKRACTATIAAAAAVALAAGMTSPASAEAGSTAERTAERMAGGSAGGSAVQATAKHRITLITGDRVVVDAKGRVVGLERAKGREKIPVQIRKSDGHTLVVPADAARLIADGKLDQRLFDVTELNKSANRKSQKQGLKVIVGYRGTAAAAKADVRDAGDTKVRRTLASLNADAVLTPRDDAPDLWAAVTDTRSGGARTASGIAHVWLDGVRKASLDKSVKQIGADKAWAAGYDGKGVKIAVLDTGVDTTHPDLKGKVVVEKNFSTAPDASDKYGHGTHVASIAAGTGAKAAGKYKGVAPGAELLNGKVLDDNGFGDDSGILAGMEWAAEQGADVVNLSLGGGDTPDIDPLEAQVNKLSKEKGVLFAIAAGNSGEFGDQTIGSPGSAEAALTVGAVDDTDKLAEFSSTGPGLDGQIKPDVTAPGVDITAASAAGSVIAQEVGENPAGYVSISGTSMATPHVAGAAAILKQQHPDWTYTELKGALTGSAKGGTYTPFQQGSGRIQVDKAIRQTVVAVPSSVSFGLQQWPHTDDSPATKKVTYKNLGTADVTLSLAVTATGPKGQAAPAGFFALGARTLTVPAGGTASADLTADTRLGGTLDGTYSAYVTATGGGQSVRTAAAVQREVESYDVTLKQIGRDGLPATAYLTDLVGYAGLGKGRGFAAPEGGTVTMRVPKGTYLLDAWILKDFETFEGGLDWVVQPKLNVTKDVSVTLDARTTKSADITVPDAGAKPLSALVSYVFDPAEFSVGAGLGSFADVRLAHLGGDVTGLTQTWSGQWTKGATAEYDVATTAEVKHIQGDKVRHYKAGELATVKNNLGAAASGKTGVLYPIGEFPADVTFGAGFEQKLPGARTLYVSTGDKVKWGFEFEQHGALDADGYPTLEAYYSLGNSQTFKAGKKYEKTFNTAVFGPRVGSDYGIYREGNGIYGFLPLFADGKTHAGSSLYSSATTTLYRNGTKVGSNSDPLVGESFEVPAADAAYKLTTSVKRSVKVAAASTRVDASWTFRSKKADLAKLPASSVRFDAAVGLDSRAPADKKVSVPVTVQGSAAGSNLKSLSVYVSYDYGQTWKKVTVKNGKIAVTNPAKGKAISFHAKIADKKGNKSTISIYNAYYGK